LLIPFQGNQRQTAEKIQKGVAEEFNRDLATRFGWTQIVSTGGALLGRPPEGSPHSRDQALVPNWSADLGTATRLMVLTHTYVDGFDLSHEQFVAEHGGYLLNDEQAFCFAVCRKVIGRLRSGK
jgi:hypothetical protein